MIKKILKMIAEAFEFMCELIFDNEWLLYMIYFSIMTVWAMTVILLSTWLISLIYELS